MKKFFIFIITAGMSAVMISCAKQEASPLQAGTVVRDTLLGVPCCIYLPDNYEARVQKTHKVFPVLYLQHGMYGIEDDWSVKGDLVRFMDSLLRCGAVKEMVVVMPDNCPGRPTPEEERANATNGEWENGFAAFMAEAESRYSISREPSQRAIAGLSMGGYHTMMVSHVLQGQFAYVAMFSPATFEHHAPVNADVFWLGIGRDDFLYDEVQKYRHWLEANHIEYTYYESKGGHTWENWQDYLCRFLPKLNFD